MTQEKPPSVLGSYIRAQRQLADLSLRQLAGLSNVSNAYLSQVERGLHQPSLKVLGSIADALDISTEHLLTQAGMMSAGATNLRKARGDGEAGEDAASPAVVDAIDHDPVLSAEEKQALLALYRTFVERHVEA
ncbi:helix-turn-helix domain-containing protein [Mobilicoccus massiliensis]|uniref:helix-turn-helix domain-containing protein n=1 Tax=Mobilicoccus massiliensis TaxID=1522310 RepID=UPI00058FF259|nr:helix-turn-helix domain-containing protein [Mobilicoccus massiliensis]